MSRKPPFPRRRSRANKPSTRDGRRSSLGFESLENRLLLSVTSTLEGNGTLDVRLSAGTDAATITTVGPNVLVSDGTNTASYAGNQVVAIAATGGTSLAVNQQSLTFNGTVAAPGGITVSGVESIVVSANATLSSRDINFGQDPGSAASQGDSSPISLSSTTIDVANGARLLAQADSGFSAGNVSLSAQDLITLTYVPGLSNFQSRQTAASIQVGDGTTIKGANVSIDSSASTAKLVSLGSADDSETTNAILLADVNGDGKPDLIEANDGQPVRLYLNNGTDQPFSAGPLDIGPMTSPGNATSLAVADVNGDGKPDLVVGYDGSAPMLFLNDGSSTAFANSTAIPIGTASHDTTSVALADLDGDSRPDLVVGNLDAPDVVYFNGSMGLGATGPVTLPGSTGGTTSLAVGYVFGRIVPEIVAGQSSASGKPTQIYLNLGFDQFANPVGLGSVVDTTAVALADVNGDGLLDVVQANDDSPSMVYLASAAAGNFPKASAEPLGATADARSVAIGDIDGDGKPDVVLGISGDTSLVYLNDGTASPFAGVAGTSVASDEASTSAVALGNVTGDGKLDLVVGTDGDVNRVYANQSTAGQVSFGDPQLFTPEDPELTYTTPLLAAGPIDLTGINLFATAVLSQADTSIAVGASTIDATGTVSILADSLSNAEITTLTKSLGVSFGSSVADSSVDVASGASIVAGGDFDLEATTNNTLYVTTVVPGLGDVGDFSLSYGYGRSNSAATIEAGAVVSSKNATISATNANIFNTATTNLNFQPEGTAAAGATVSIGDYQSEAKASVDGQLKSTGNAEITASSVNTKDNVAASASNIPKLQDAGLVGKASELGTMLQDSLLSVVPGVTLMLPKALAKGGFLSDALNLTHGSPAFGIQAGMAFQDDSNDADASIGSGARVVSGGNLSVTSDAEDTIQSGASASSGNASTLSLGGAILVATLSNTSEATVGAGAVADAGGTLDVSAVAHQPNIFSYFNLNAYIPDPYDPSTGGASDILANYTTGFHVGDVVLPIVDSLLTILTTGAAIGANVANAFTSAAGSGDGTGSVGIAASLSVLDQTNSATASIDDNALVNQDDATPSTQDVTVTTDAQVESIDPNGEATVLGALAKAPGLIAGSAEGYGVGGTLFFGDFHDTSDASIGAGARVKAGRDVTVGSTGFNFIVAGSQAGTQSSEAGFQASIAYIGLDTQTLASISNTAVINAGRDVNDTAGSQTDDVGFTGGLVLSKNLGAGISSTILDLEDTTDAFIGTPGGSAGASGSVTAGRNLTLDADSEQNVVNVAVAGASSYGADPKPETSQAASGGANGQPVPASIVAAEDGRTYGIDVSGEVAFNLVTPTTEAFIQGLGTITVGGDTSLSATSQNIVVATGGGVVVASNIGLGGNAVQNLLDPTTLAYTTGVTLALAGNLSVEANSDDIAPSVAVGGSGAQGSVSVAGSADFTVLDNDTEADLGPDTVANVGGTADIEATNRIILPSAAGAASVAAGVDEDGEDAGPGIGVGAAIVVSLVENTVLADVDGTSTLSAGDDVQVLATSHEYLTTVAAALGAGGVGGIGADGSIDGLAFNQDVEAYLGDGGTITTPSSVTIGAYDQMGLVAIAGGGAGGEAAGVGLSVAIPILDRTVQAYVGAGAILDASGKGLTIDAEDDDYIALAALSGALSTDIAGQASVVFDLDTNATNAFIGANARINTSGGADADQSVLVNATHDTDYLSVAGGFSVVASLSGAGVGAAISTETDDRTVTASIGAGAVVDAQDDVIVTTSSAVSTLEFVAGISGGGQVAAQGSILDTNLDGTVQSYLDDGSTVTAQGNVDVSANSKGNYTAFAGQAAATVGQSINVSLAGSLVANVIDLATDAYVGVGTVVTALGRKEEIQVPTGQVDSDDDEETAPIVGLAVTATGDEFVTAVSLGGSVGANVGGLGEFAATGAASANVLMLKTLALIDDSAQVNIADATASDGQDVDVLAVNHVLDATAGGTATATILVTDPEDDPEAVGASVGAGVAATEDQIRTVAEIDPLAVVLSNGSVQVQAIATETAIAVAGALSIGLGLDAPEGAIAGTVSVRVLQATTTAEIGSGATVTAQGNILVSADNQTATLLGDGDFGGGEGGLAGSIGVVVITPTTTSFIDSDAVVTALAKRGTMTAEDGHFVTSDSSYDPGDPSAENFVPPTIGDILPSGLDASSLLDGALFFQRTDTPEMTTLSGLAVTALGRNVIEKAVISGGLGGVALALAGSVNVVDGQTSAYIGQGALVNTSDVGASQNQDVLVAAGSDYFNISVVGTGTAAAAVAAGPSIDVSVVTLGTEAYVGQYARVGALGDVAIIADALEDNISLIAAGAGSRFLAAAGSFGILYLDDTTLAFVDADGLVDAGGNVDVSATDDTVADTIAGALALSFTGGSFGASAGADPIVKDTEAYIGTGASVTGSANSGRSMLVFTGALAPDGGFSTTNAVGVAVEASSSETLFLLSASGTEGGISLAGAASIEILEAKTLAYIESDAVVDGSTSGANQAQLVVVAAVDQTEVTAIDGSLGLGTSLAGGVDADIDRNQTSATIGSGAQVNARGNIDVFALAQKGILSYVVSAAAGGVGIGGAADVQVIGGLLDAPIYHDPNDKTHTNAGSVLTANDGSSNSLTSNLDGQIGQSSSTPVGAVLEDLTGYDPNQDQQVASIASDAGSSAGAGLDAESGDLSAQAGRTDAPQGTSAIIGDDAIVVAGGSVTVSAVEGLSLQMIVGGVALTTGIGFGGSAGVVIVGDPVTAAIDDGATVDADTGSVNVDANLANDTISATSFDGAVGGLVGLGAQALVLIDHSAESASIGNGVTIATAPGGVSIDSETNRNLDAKSVGVQAAGVFSAGVAIAYVEEGGTTTATIGDSAAIGSAQAPVGTVKLDALSSDSATTHAVAASAGIGAAAQGSVGIARVDPTVQATVGSSGTILSGGDIDVSATETSSVDSTAFGIALAGIGTLGVSLTDAEVTPTLSLSVGSGDDLDADGSILFTATANGAGVQTSATSSAFGALLGGTGSSATAVDSPTINESLGTSTYTSGSDLNLSAIGDDATSADARGYAGGIVGVGVSLASATSSPDFDQTIAPYAHFQAGTVFLMSNSSDDTAAATTQAIAGGLFAGVGTSASATIKPVLSVSLGSGVVIDSEGNIEIQGIEDAMGMTSASGIAVGAVGVGISRASTSVSPTIDVATGQGDTFAASGAFAIESLANPLARNSTATATSSSAGIAGIAGSDATLDDAPDVESHLGADTSLNAGSISIVSRTDDYGTAEALGDSLGILGVGASTALATSNATNVADVGDSSTLVTLGDATVSAETDPGVSSEATAGSGGILAGFGASSESDANATTTADLGQADILLAGGTFSIAGTTMQSFTPTLDRPSTQAFAFGTSAGGITVGESLATTNADSTLDVSIGQGDSVSGGTVNVTAQDGDATYNQTFGSSPTADAEGSNGSLFGDLGTDASSSIVNNVHAFVAPGAKITAGDVSVTTDVSSLATPIASNNNDGVITIGEASGSASLTTDNLAELQSGVTVNATGDVQVSAVTDNNAYDQAYGHGDSLVNDSLADTMTTVYYKTNAAIGSGDSINAGLDLYDQAFTSNSAINVDSNDAGAFAADPGADSTIVVAGQYVDPGTLQDFSQSFLQDAAPTEASVGDNASLNGGSVHVTADTDETAPLGLSVPYPIGGYSDATADGFALNPNSYSGVAHDTQSYVDIGRAAVLDAGYVGISAYQDDLADYDFANSHGSGVGGDTTAYGNLGQITDTVVVVEPLSVIITPYLYVGSTTPTADFDHYISADASDILDTGEAHDEWRGSSYNDINFSATVEIQATPEILRIDPYGNVIQDQGITFSRFGQIIDVADIDGGGVGTLIFNIEVPAVTGPDGTIDTKGYSPEESNLLGSPTFVFETTVPDVTISNASNNYLLINNITTDAFGVPGIVYEGVLAGIQNTPNDPFAAYVSESNGTPAVTITQTGNEDVDLAGQIITRDGLISVTNTGGSIVATTSRTSLDASTIALDASGDVDASGLADGVPLFQEDGSTLTVSGQAGGELDLGLAVQGLGNQPAKVVLTTLQAGGDINLDVYGTTNATSTLIQVDRATAGKTITIDDGSSGGSSTSLEVSGTISTPGEVLLEFPNGSVTGDAGSSIVASLLAINALSGVSLTTTVAAVEIFTLLGAIYLSNTGDLVIGQPGEPLGIGLDAAGSITLLNYGDVVLDQPVIGDGVGFLVDSISEATSAAYVSSPSLVIDVFGGQIGSAVVPFGFRSYLSSPATIQTETFDSTSSTNQYLADLDTVGALITGSLEDDQGTIVLDGGSFDDEGLVEASNVDLLAGTLSGRGQINGSLQATGGTLDPGDTTGPINLAGNGSLQAGSTFQVHLTLPSGATTPVSNSLQGTGIVNLSGVNLAVALGAGYTPRPGDQFTIIRSSGPIVGTFAQGNHVVVAGQTFQILYGTNTVVLKLDTAPVLVDIEVDFGGKEYSILNLGRDLPWNDITAIDLIFNEPVVVPLGSITLTGINLANYKLTITENGDDVHLALPSAIGIDRLMLSIANLQDLYAAPLASPITDSFAVLPGDFNGDGVVAAADMTGVNNATVGPYTIFADLNGDGVVDINDVKIARSAIGTKLPPKN